MKFIKKNLAIIIILLLGLFLRVNFDTFLFGYNFDEYAIVSLAKLNFIDMFKAIAQEDYHAPLYYIVVHFFIGFKNCDLYLRFLNIFISLLNIFVFYKIGKLLCNKNLGIVLSLIFAVSHLQISIANFIKFYCLNFLLISISIYYFIKFVKYGKNSIKLGITNLFVCLSFTFGIVFVFLEYLILFLNKNKKEVLKSSAIALLGVILYIPILFFQTQSALNNIISPHGNYPSLSFFGLYMLLSDYFSPLTNYSCNTETVEAIALIVKSLRSIVEKSNFDLISYMSFVILSFIPVSIGVIGIINSYKNDVVKKLFYLALGYFTFQIIVTKLEITGLIPLYSYQGGLILIILSTYGLYKIKNKIKWFLIGYLICSQLIITNVYPIEKRETKHKIYGNIDKYIEKIDKDTPIISIDAGRFAKYYYKNKNIISLDSEELQGSHDTKWLKLAYGDDINKKNLKNKIQKAILNNKESLELNEYLEKNIFKNINKNSEMVIILNFDGSAFIFDEKELKTRIQKKYDSHLENSSLKYQLYKKEDEILNQSSLGDVITSHVIRLISNEIEKEFKIIKIEQFILTKNGIYEKISQQNENFPKTYQLLESSALGWLFVTYQKK